jgi:hypothetical protein
MKSWRLALGAMGVFALMASALAAQWPDYPTPGVPRLANGQPNLEGPVPRGADGKPDFSGIWSFRGGGGGGGGGTGAGGRGQAAQGGQGARGAAQGGQTAGVTTDVPSPQAPPQQGRVLQTSPTGVPFATFFDIGANIAGGAPYTPWAADVRKQRMADNMKDNPDANCLPLGLTQMHMHPQPRKIVQLPKLIIMLYEAQGGVRQIFMDGRPLPNNDPQPWWYAYSIGRWEGDTLVVESSGFRDDVWLDVNGSPLTSTGKMTERMKRVNYGNMETEITIEDPKSYTKPFTVTVNHRIMVDTDLIEFICAENEKSSRYFDK